jgi:hypothetical protein
MPDRSTKQVFLCHSSADKKAVRDLYHRLKQHGRQPWLDEEDILPGKPWEDEIREAVRSSAVVVVCISRAAINTAGFFHKEIRFALDVADEKPEGTTYVIPARLDNCDVPSRLTKWHWVDLFEPHGFDRLLRALGVDNSACPTKPCVLISDGTSFSMNLLTLAGEAGFRSTHILGPTLPPTSRDIEEELSESAMILLTRGEHYEAAGHATLYTELKQFVRGGAFLLATPWVSWETYSTGLLADLLPFHHPAGRFHEDAHVKYVNPLDGAPVSFVASFEDLGETAAGAALLLECENGNPLMGVRNYGDGCCLYLNVCQHSCNRSMKSPIESSNAFADLVKQTFIDIYTYISSRPESHLSSDRLPTRVQPSGSAFQPRWFTKATSPGRENDYI